jgi:cobalt-zinc-cadmium efflux system membrane fusion protein
MISRILKLAPQILLWSIAGVVVVVVGAAVLFQDRWWPQAVQFAGAVAGGRALKQVSPGDAASSAAHAEEHGHDHAHEGHDESSSLELTPQGRANLGLTQENVQPVALGSFTRTLDLPARVVEQPGRTRIQIPAPMAGVVTSVHVVQGEAIAPGTLLFRLRLTHEDQVAAQSKFLTTLGQLDVELREIQRLTSPELKGVVAGKRVLEREYEKQRLEATLGAQREALRLHGLTREQVEQIEKQRTLISEIEIRAPTLTPGVDRGGTLAGDVHDVAYTASLTTTADAPTSAYDPLFVVGRLKVQVGAFVSTGEPLCELMDLSQLYIEGQAFEQDADELNGAEKNGWTVSAVPETGQKKIRQFDGLHIVYIDNEVEADSRALRFYVALPNEIVSSQRVADHRFVAWRFKPGQRMQLRVPVEQWKDRIVLPIDAVAQSAAEYYVFQQNGHHFDRVPVHVEYRDQYNVVIANDGSLFPGDVVALTGAQQMQMALKNKAGGGVDPHAGHSH